MTLSRQVVVPGMVAEYASFGDLLRARSLEEWAAPSRCEGWTVADVAGHVVGQLTDVVNLRLDDLGSPGVTARQVHERRGRGPAELADELDASRVQAEAIAASFDDTAWDNLGPQGGSTLGFGIESMWFDTWLHAEDIRNAVGLAPGPRDGIAPSLSHIAQVLTDQGFQPAILAFDGYGPFSVSGGGGRSIEGDPYRFVHAATGRGDPASIGLDDTVNIYR